MRNISQDDISLEYPPAGGVWERVSHFAAEIQESAFMAEMTRHLDEPGGHGLMGALDCATLYGLTRWRRPTVVVETGGYLGMSSAFILKALADEGLAEAKVFSLEMNQDCDHGALIPSELRSQFVSMRGRVEDFIKGNELPSRIDMFFARQFAPLPAHALGISAILGSTGRRWIARVARCPFQPCIRRVRRENPGP